jgi:hypothetical protein
MDISEILVTSGPNFLDIQILYGTAVSLSKAKNTAPGNSDSLFYLTRGPSGAWK